MTGMFILFAVLIIAIMIFNALITRRGEGDSAAYFKNSHLFTPAERSFFGVLSSAIGNEYALFGKVRVADVLSVAPGTRKSHWWRAFNKISGKHFDFVICDKSDFAIVAVIELDDQSHQAKRRQVRDAFLVKICAGANLALFQFAAKATYNPNAVREQIMGVLKSAPQSIASAAPNAAPAIAPVSLVATVAPNIAPADTTQNEPPRSCPKCALPMAQRTAKSGEKTGRPFWACTGYPKCRSVAPI